MFVGSGTRKLRLPRDGKSKMEFGRHAMQGDISGNLDQPEGKHIWGVRLIPLGDRYRVRPTEIYLVGNAEEAESVDRVTSRKR